jgi:uncharacterized RDD family membrane protein YckC
MKTFSARETVWLQELDGIELAGFRRRAAAFVLDGIFAGLALSIIVGLAGLAYAGVRKLEGRPVHLTDMNKLDNVFGDKAQIHIGPDQLSSTPAAAPPSKPHITYSIVEPDKEQPHTFAEEAVNLVSDIVIPVLYFGIFLWQGNGRTPGKRILKIRVVSLVHTHLSFWHSVERALGYGAAALEGGFGFLQYFIHPYRRCAQDRLAETIVVTERGYQQKFPARLGTPPESETALQ